LGKKKDGVVVAVKDSKSVSGKILPGKVLGRYRKKEFASRDLQKLAQRAGFGGSCWRVGIFQNGKLIS